MSLLKLAAFLLGTARSVVGHGYVTRINVDGTTYGGYLVDTYYYEPDPPGLIAWSTTATDTGYVAPGAYGDPDIVCHRGAEPGRFSAEISPGSSVTLYWSTWPTDHHGPVITYLANCNGDCASVVKTDLEFFKIDAGGLIDNSAVPGTWASDELIAANFSWTVTIPPDIASGNYVLRHEIVALHSAANKGGAQSYPQCINLKITGSGTATPAGTLGTELYKDTDTGIYVNIWNALSSYVIPGPALYTAGSSDSGSNSATSLTTSVTTVALSTMPSAEATTTLSTATNAINNVTSAQCAVPTDITEHSSVSPSQATGNLEGSFFIEPEPSTTATASNGPPDRLHGKGQHCSAHTGKSFKRDVRKFLNGRRHARNLSV
ncbi:hypothetical protein BDW72DRAFT_188789 [Aspergillus terricola var. indicus]